MLTACTEFRSGPAPVFVNGGAGTAASRPAAKTTTPDTRFVTVQPGQSLGGNRRGEPCIEAVHHSGQPPFPSVQAENRAAIDDSGGYGRSHGEARQHDGSGRAGAFASIDSHGAYPIAGKGKASAVGGDDSAR